MGNERIIDVELIDAISMNAFNLYGTVQLLSDILNEIPEKTSDAHRTSYEANCVYFCEWSQSRIEVLHSMLLRLAKEYKELANKAESAESFSKRSMDGVAIMLPTQKEVAK